MKLLPEARAKASQQWLDEAAKTLRDNGYVVIPRERHVVLRVQRSLSWLEHEHLSKDAEGWKRFSSHIDAAAAREIGHAMLDKGAVTKTEHVGTWAYYTQYQADIILPN